MARYRYAKAQLWSFQPGRWRSHIPKNIKHSLLLEDTRPANLEVTVRQEYISPGRPIVRHLEPPHKSLHDGALSVGPALLSLTTVQYHGEFGRESFIVYQPVSHLACRTASECFSDYTRAHTSSPCSVDAGVLVSREGGWLCRSISCNLLKMILEIKWAKRTMSKTKFSAAVKHLIGGETQAIRDGKALVRSTPRITQGTTLAMCTTIPTRIIPRIPNSQKFHWN